MTAGGQAIERPIIDTTRPARGTAATAWGDSVLITHRPAGSHRRCQDAAGGQERGAIWHDHNVGRIEVVRNVLVRYPLEAQDGS